MAWTRNEAACGCCPRHSSRRPPPFPLVPTLSPHLAPRCRGRRPPCRSACSLCQCPSSPYPPPPIPTHLIWRCRGRHPPCRSGRSSSCWPVPVPSRTLPASPPVPTPPHTSHLAVSGTAPSLPVRMFFTVLALPFSMLMAPINMLLEMLSRWPRYLSQGPEGEKGGGKSVQGECSSMRCA